MVMTFSGIRLSQIFVSKSICIYKSVQHDVVGTLITSESSRGVFGERNSHHPPFLPPLCILMQCVKKFTLLLWRKGNHVEGRGREIIVVYSVYFDSTVKITSLK